MPDFFRTAGKVDTVHIVEVKVHEIFQEQGKLTLSVVEAKVPEIFQRAGIIGTINQ